MVSVAMWWTSRFSDVVRIVKNEIFLRLLFNKLSGCRLNSFISCTIKSQFYWLF